MTIQEFKEYILEQLPNNISRLIFPIHIRKTLDALADIVDAKADGALYLAISEWTTNGYIRADKIGALTLLDVIQATETTIANFTTNSGNYTFQRNDMIAIPISNGKYSMYMYNGGDKTNISSYFEIGITNITQSQVVGLIDALAAKVDKPSTDGVWVYKKLGTVFSWDNITNYGQNVANSFLTTIASTGINLGASWRIKTNTYPLSFEDLPDKSADSTFNLVLGTNAAGQIAKSNGWTAINTAMGAATDVQKDAWRIASRKTNENYSLGQPRVDNILPPLINKNLGYVQYVTIIGLNLFVDNVTQGQAQIKLKNTTTNQEFLINQFTSYQHLPDRLTFGVDFATYPQGDYSVSVFHNGQWSLPNLNRFLTVRENLTPLPLPNLTWELADTTGIKPTLNKVSTYSDRIFFDTIPLSSKYFAQSVESLFNNQDLIDGAVAVFNVTFMGGDAPSHADMYWGFSSGSFSNNTQFDTNVQIFGVYTYWMYIYFRPSNKSYTKYGGGRRTVLTDTVYVTVKNGVVDYFFVNNNMITTEVLSNFSTADFKMKIAGFSNAGDGSITPLIDIKLINKFSLAN